MRNKIRIILFTLLTIFTFAEEIEIKYDTDENGYKYAHVDGIYSDTREYTLENGLKVYLTKKENTPNIYSKIVVRAGSKNDPEDTTGLAHYFEHLMFKGSDEIGTIDWGKEKPILDEIEKLFEEHKKETDIEKKKEIYSKIDKLSYEASKYSIASEYSNLVSSIGGNNLNAYTTYDSTEFTMDFPSENIEKAMLLERKRFDNVSLREFHTELETVYEEYNLSQNNGLSVAFDATMKEMFKNTQYEHPIIGSSYDLKNPSIKSIREFYDKYYVANNMAIILSGNLEYADTIKMIDKYWGDYRQNNNINTLKKVATRRYLNNKSIDISVANNSGLYVAVKINPNDETLSQFTGKLLYNGLDGIFDKLILDHKIQAVEEDTILLNDGAVAIFKLASYSNKSLEYTNRAFLSGIKMLKDGKFEDSQINNVKKQYIDSYDTLKNNNEFLVSSLKDVFVSGKDLAYNENDYLNMLKLTRKDIIDFANRTYNNYFTIFAYNDPVESEKLEKPKITALVSNTSKESEFAKTFKKMPSNVKKFNTDKLEKLESTVLKNGVKLYYVQNKDNNKYQITYAYPIGIDDSTDLGVSSQLFYEIGTKNIKLEKLQNIMSEKGIMIEMSVINNLTEFSLTGVESNKSEILEEMKIFEEKISNNEPQDKEYNGFKNNISHKLSLAKENSEFISEAAISYITSGKNSWFYKTGDYIKSINIRDGSYYAQLINNVNNIKPTIFVYSSLPKDEILKLIDQTHNFNNLENKDRLEDDVKTINKGKVYLTNINSKLVDISFLSEFGKLDKESYLFSVFYNEYENGLNGRTFNEIREKKGLTYDVSNYITAYEKYPYIVLRSPTQNDKTVEMIESVKEFLGDANKLDEKTFDMTKRSLINQYENQMLKGYQLYSSYTEKVRLGLETDDSKFLEQIKKYSFEDYKKMYTKKIKNTNFSIAITGNKESFNADQLKKYGEIIELTPEILIGEENQDK